MRYSKEESTYILGVFNSGDSVTITIYRLSDNTKVVDGATCSEIGTTGIFKYLFSQTITQKEEYLWIMSNGSYSKYGKIVLGGWMDTIKYDVADAVWDESRSDHTTEGTYGNTDEWAGQIDIDAIADAIWDENINQHQKANTTGYALKHITGGIVPARQPITVKDKEKILEYLETLLKKINTITSKLSDEQLKKLAEDLSKRLTSDIEKQNELRDRILLSLADINTLEELLNYEYRADSSGVSEKKTRITRNHYSKT